MAIYETASKEDIASIRSDDPFLDTIHLSHPDTATEFWLVRDTDDHEFDLEDTSTQLFSGSVGFEIKAPTIASEGVQSMDVVIDTTKLDVLNMVREVRESKHPFKIVYRQYQLSRPETPARKALTMSLTDFVADIHLLKSKAKTKDIVNTPLLGVKYTIDTNPGLKQ